MYHLELKPVLLCSSFVTDDGLAAETGHTIIKNFGKLFTLLIKINFHYINENKMKIYTESAIHFELKYIRSFASLSFKMFSFFFLKHLFSIEISRVLLVELSCIWQASQKILN